MEKTPARGLLDVEPQMAGAAFGFPTPATPSRALRQAGATATRRAESLENVAF
jgi:hypothetical protein